MKSIKKKYGQNPKLFCMIGFKRFLTLIIKIIQNDCPGMRKFKW